MTTKSESHIPEKYDVEQTVLAAARRHIEALATEYRTRVLVPFCRRHGLVYIAGNGRTVFYTRDDRSFGSAGEAELEGCPEAARIFEVLDQDCIGREDYFGFYVADVREADIGRSEP